MRPPFYLCPVENENSDLLFIYFWGEEVGRGFHLSPFSPSIHPTAGRIQFWRFTGMRKRRAHLNAMSERALTAFQNQAAATDVPR